MKISNKFYYSLTIIILLVLITASCRSQRVEENPFLLPPIISNKTIDK